MINLFKKDILNELLHNLNVKGQGGNHIDSLINVIVQDYVNKTMYLVSFFNKKNFLKCVRLKIKRYTKQRK